MIFCRRSGYLVVMLSGLQTRMRCVKIFFSDYQQLMPTAPLSCMTASSFCW